MHPRRGANMLDPPMQPTYIATCTRRVSPGQYENMSREEAIQGSLADCLPLRLPQDR